MGFHLPPVIPLPSVPSAVPLALPCTSACYTPARLLISPCYSTTQSLTTTMHRQSTFLRRHSNTNTSSTNSSPNNNMDLSESQSSLPLAVDTHLPVPPLVNNISSKLRSRLSFKSARAAYAEREILKRENRAARPLTQRNMDTFLIEQDLHDARVRRAENLHVSQWLQQLP